MKWKKLYNFTIGLTTVTMGLFTAINLGGALIFDQPTGGRVWVKMKFAGDKKDASGHYNLSEDKVTLFYQDGYNIRRLLVHELKHSDNAVKFSYRLSTDSEELSAICGEELQHLETQQKIKRDIEQLSKNMPESAHHAPMDSLIAQRFKTPFERWNGREVLEQERDKLLDSIRYRFDGAIRDSLSRVIKEKYRNVSKFDLAAAKIREKYKDESYQVEPGYHEREVDYVIPDLNQSQIDEMFKKTMDDWGQWRNNLAYLVPRMAFLLNANLHPMNDAELEKLFTYNINGQHRSLYKEASPEIKKQVRRMANGDNFAFMVKRALGRE